LTRPDCGYVVNHRSKIIILRFVLRPRPTGLRIRASYTG